MDHRLKRLSNSSRDTLHLCGRKYQLYKLNSVAEVGEETNGEGITFAFGHVVGLGVQLAFQEKSEEEIIWQMFLMWNVDLEARHERQNKGFYKAVFAVQKFMAMLRAGLYKDYELVYYNGKPAVELGFCINFPDGFKYRGFVDLVLRHKITGKILVVDAKTTSSRTVVPATYKNSGQGLGYSVVLDVIFGEASDYTVEYLVYPTHSLEWTRLPFEKTYLQRALWIQEVMLDIEIIKLYENTGVYPMHGGKACNDFFRECEYLNLCTMSTSVLTKPEPEETPEEFTINVSLQDLIAAQLRKE